jgi:hypothetical protein
MQFRDASMAATQPDVVTWAAFKPVIKKNLNKAPVTKADFTLYSNRVIRFGIAQVDQHPVHKTTMPQSWCVALPQPPATVHDCKQRGRSADASFFVPDTLYPAAAHLLQVLRWRPVAHQQGASERWRHHVRL